MFLISRRGSGCAGLLRGARGAGSVSRERCISSTPHSVFSRTPDLSCYQRILAFLTSFTHLFILTVFVAFVRFWHVLRSAVLHLLPRDHFIQITETTNNDPYSSSPQNLGTCIFDRHFSAAFITIHTKHCLIHVSTPTAFLCGGIKKKRPSSIQVPFYAGAKRHKQRRR